VSKTRRTSTTKPTWTGGKQRTTQTKTTYGPPAKTVAGAAGLALLFAGAAASQAGSATSRGGAPRPGLFAPNGYRDLFDALRDGDKNALKTIAANRRSEARPIAQAMLAKMRWEGGDPETEDAVLEALELTSEVDMNAHPFVQKHLDTAVRGYVYIPVALGVTVYGSPFERTILTLMAAELRQRRGDVATALELLETLEPSPARALSKCELLATLGSAEAVLAESSATLATGSVRDGLLVYQGWALNYLGQPKPAIKVLKTAVGSLQAGEARQAAWFYLALARAECGQTWRSKRLLKKVLKADPSHSEAREALDALG